MDPNNRWNAQQWLADFRIAASTKNHEQLHQLRRDVYADTTARVNADLPCSTWPTAKLPEAE